jgi:hypothetical protein
MFKDGDTFIEKKAELIAGLSLEVVERQKKIVGFKILNDQSNETAINFCREIQDELHFKKMDVTVSGSSLIFFNPKNVVTGHIKLKLKNREECLAIKNILEGRLGEAYIHDLDGHGFEVRLDE